MYTLSESSLNETVLTPPCLAPTLFSPHGVPAIVLLKTGIWSPGGCGIWKIGLPGVWYGRYLARSTVRTQGKLLLAVGLQSVMRTPTNHDNKF